MPRTSIPEPVQITKPALLHAINPEINWVWAVSLPFANTRELTVLDDHLATWNGPISGPLTQHFCRHLGIEFARAHTGWRPSPDLLDGTELFGAAFLPTFEGVVVCVEDVPRIRSAADLWRSTRDAEEQRRLAGRERRNQAAPVRVVKAELKAKSAVEGALKTQQKEHGRLPTAWQHLMDDDTI